MLYIILHYFGLPKLKPLFLEGWFVYFLLCDFIFTN